MRTLVHVIACFVSYASAFAVEKEQAYHETTMLPLARQFVSRHSLTPSRTFTANEIDRIKIDFFMDRPGAQATLRLTNNQTFSFHTEGTNSEVCFFQDHNVRPFLDYAYGPPERAEAMRTLNRSNKLSDEAALALLKKHFIAQGHSETNFHAIEFRRMTSGMKGETNYVEMPFYEAQWYRKDVKQADRDAGYIVVQPHVHIIVSGITSNLIYYGRYYLPIGHDF